MCHVWIGRGLRETAAPPFSKDLARGIGMEDMLRALAIPLLGLAAAPRWSGSSVFKPRSDASRTVAGRRPPPSSRGR